MRWNGGINYGDRTSITHNQLGDYGDINSEDAEVIARAKAYVQQLHDLGVKGIRWDAAKHIALPSENCGFWTAVTSVEGMYHYGEILDSPGPDASIIKEYTTMKVVTFGELMVRLQPFNYERFVQANSLEFTFGGGEANVAVSLANYGIDAAFVTKLPAHAIGQAAVNSLRRYGVDTSKITRGGDRVGIYFNEKGASQRGSVCIYDRANSAIQLASTADFDWDAIFEGVDWFHFTGITPALGENVVEICREACKAAKAHGVKISCDLNYRGKLWTREQARAAMTDLCQYVDVCISNEEDAKDVFGIEAEATDIYAGEINREGYKSVAKQLADKFGFEKVAITLRESHSASDNGWSAMLYDVASNEYCFSKKYDLHIIDRVGGGDSFGGGLIYSLLTGKSTQEAVEFAVAASALKHSIEGDYNMMTVSEVEKLAGGDGSGRIQR